MTNMMSKNRVLEVGCGPGKHSLMLATSFLKQGSVLVSCDFSESMVKKLHHNYYEGNQDFTLNPANKFYIDTETDYQNLKCDLDKVISEKAGEEFKKFVFGCRANNEVLPFPDNYFDAYISNLSLHIVHNHKNQLAEAFRVM